jgi:hypothetical protein
MEASIPKQSPEDAKATEQFREAAKYAVGILKGSLDRLKDPENVIIYKLFSCAESATVEDYKKINAVFEPFVMSALRDELSDEELNKYYFAYLPNHDEKKTVIGCRLMTDKDRAKIMEMKQKEAEEAAKKEAESKTGSDVNYVV